MTSLILMATDKEPTTTSLIIAEGLGRSHESVIKLIRKFEKELSAFGPLGFEIRKGEPLPQGGFAKPTEFAHLTEQQTTFLFSLMRNTPEIVSFKLRLVKAFFAQRAALEKIKNRRADDRWIERKTEAALEFKLMSQTLVERRKVEGKETKPFHFSNEAKLVNFAMTGQYKSMNRKDLSSAELHILTQLEIKNAVFLGAGLDRETRKAALLDLHSSLSPLKVAAA